MLYYPIYTEIILLWKNVFDLIKTGEISHGSVLGRAMSLCAQREESCNWPNIPEKDWQQAIKETIDKEVV